MQYDICMQWHIIWRKKNEILIHATSQCMTIENIALRSQSEKTTYCMILFM